VLVLALEFLNFLFFKKQAVVMGKPTCNAKRQLRQQKNGLLLNMTEDEDKDCKCKEFMPYKGEFKP
jgi:hypothetical protein